MYVRRGIQHTRARCPICGMVVWDSQLERDNAFELFVQQSMGAHGFQFRNTGEPDREAKVWMAEKLEAVAARLREE